MIILLLLLQRSLAAWKSIFDKFNAPDFPDSDDNGWSFRTYSGWGGSGETYCSGSSTDRSISCNANHNKLIELRDGCEILRNTFNNLIPHSEAQIYFDVYYLSADTNGWGSQDFQFKFYFENNIEVNRSYRQNDLPYNKDNCRTDFDEKFDYNSHWFRKSHSSSSLSVEFYGNAKDEYTWGGGGTTYRRRLGLRNIQILINTCNKFCKGCSTDEQVKCTSCFTGSPDSNGVCPPCTGNTLFIDVTKSNCQQECSRSKLADSENVCEYSSKLSVVETAFDNNSLNSYGNWEFILDPIYYFINAQTRIYSCGSKDYIGPLGVNEAIQRSLTLDSNVQFIRVMVSFIFRNWQDGASLQILLDEVPRGTIYQASGLIQTTNCQIIVDSTSSCGQLIRIEMKIQTKRINSVLRFKGNMNLDSNENWSLRDVFIDQLVCETNCDTCDTSTTCSVCSSGYVRHKGSCLQSCPIYSTQIGSTCKDFDEEKEGTFSNKLDSKYKIKAFYDTSTLSNDILEIIGTHSTIGTDYNLKSGQLYGYLPYKRVFGGAFSWHNARIVRNIAIAEPHYGYTYRMEIILGEGQGDFTYSFSGSSVTLTGSGSTNSSNIWGKSAAEKQYSKTNFVSQTGNIDIDISYDCSDTNPENCFAALSNYFLIVHYCPLYCTGCTGPLPVDCEGYDQTDTSIDFTATPIQCKPHRYFDINATPEKCPPCPVECDTCTDAITCTLCQSSFYLESGLCRCYFGFYKSGATCLPCNDICNSCTGPNTNDCLTCHDSQHRMFDQDQCVCQPHYQEDPDSLICIPICGDMIVVEGEDCDDGNDIQYDGCHQCQYQCALNCKTCLMGVCYDCFDGYALQGSSRTCLSICGDQFIAGNEECDDGNETPYDGCHECQFSCQPECSQCVNGICQGCQEGWYLQSETFKCQSFCGDQIVVYTEECDDGNMDPFDGCFSCQYSCTDLCYTCAGGTCYSCILGYSLNSSTELCEPICGDSIIVGNEFCDDGNTIPYDGCHNCQYSCQPECTLCQKGICLECDYPGWYLDPITFRCHTKLHDGYLVSKYEQCDDFNQTPFDGCFMGLFSCPIGCQFCISNNECLSCYSEWQLDLDEHKCYPICGDGISVDNEECDDENHNPMVCRNCKLRCPDNCEQCSYGKCIQCKVGYESVLVDGFSASVFSCSSICGDLVISNEVEQCDDGNLFPFDGCFECKASCQEECTGCSFDGQCYSCLDGYILSEDRRCIPNCGDGTIQRYEECDDTLFNQVSCRKCSFKQIDNCLVFEYGFCKQCKAGYQLVNNQCYQVCEDAIEIGETQKINHSYLLSFYSNRLCYDIDQSCIDQEVGCIYECTDYCLDCQLGQCIKCDEQEGYYLTEGICQSICGDSIKAHDEQCDDGISNFVDGCSECKFTCHQFCKVCNVTGICLICQKGYFLDVFNFCKPISGDGKVTLNEICDYTQSDPFNECFNEDFVCGEQCVACAKGQCQQCNQLKGYYLNPLTLQCESQCGDQIVSFNEECDSNSNYCTNCQFSCSQNCITCSKGTCYICNSGFYLIDNECQPFCGDGLVLANEQCDDSNAEPYDGCFNCQYSCQQECTSCINGKCQDCQTVGWKFDEFNEICTSICGDQLVVGNEQCDDGNLTPYDGCFECKLQCQEACTWCQLGACFECNTDGWYLNVNLCESICGDAIVVGNEQCDDGNDVRYDGCYNCEFDCQKSCLTCHYGYCFLCDVGWSFDEYKCEPICGDSIVVEVEECDDGNDIPNDGCHECKYSCDLNCELCGTGVCSICKQGWEISSSGVCSPICGDKIVQQGYEDCDDGNNVEFDGCFNCQYSCHEACTQCVNGSCQQCNTLGWTVGQGTLQCIPLCGDGIVIAPEQCDDQNTIPYDGCYDCQYQCHQKCQTCSKGYCLQCEIGWYQESEQCTTICGDGIYVSDTEQCDDGNIVDGDGCSSSCKQEELYQCTNNENFPSMCCYAKVPEIILTEIQHNDYQSTSKLTFNQQMMLQEEYYQISNYTQYIQVELLDHFTYDYSTEIEPIQEPGQEATNVEYLITITFYVSSSQPKILVSLANNLESVYKKQLITFEAKLKLTEPRIISQNEKENAQQISQFSQNIMISIGVVSTVSLLTGSTVIFQNMLDQLQFLSYIKYVNVVFPENLQIYFDAFNIVSLGPILSLLKIDDLINLLNGSEDSYIKPQKKFADDGVNAYFLDNFVSFVFCIFSAYFSYYISTAGNSILQKINNYEISKFNQLKQKAVIKIRKELNSFQSNFYYSGLISVFLANYYDISFAALLQITNLNFSNINFMINSLASILVFLGQIVLTYKLLTQSEKFIKKTSFIRQTEYSALFQGVENSSQQFWSLQLNTLLSIKKLFFMIIIIAVQDNGALQSVTIAFQSTLYLIYLIKGSPIANQYEYKKIVISEVITIFNSLTFLIYAVQKIYFIPYEQQLTLGWIHIATLTSQLASTFIIDFAQQSSIFYHRLKQMITKPKLKSDIPQQRLFQE